MFCLLSGVFVKIDRQSKIVLPKDVHQDIERSGSDHSLGTQHWALQNLFCSLNSERSPTSWSIPMFSFIPSPTSFAFVSSDPDTLWFLVSSLDLARLSSVRKLLYDLLVFLSSPNLCQSFSLPLTIHSKMSSRSQNSYKIVHFLGFMFP